MSLCLQVAMVACEAAWPWTPVRSASRLQGCHMCCAHRGATTTQVHTTTRPAPCCHQLGGCSVELLHRIHGCGRQPFARDPVCVAAAAVPSVLKTPTGPPEDVSEPLQIFDLLRQDWEAPSSRGREPHYADVSGSGGRRKRVRVFASSFDAFVDEVLAVMPSLNLPVVTGGSITCLKQHNFNACKKSERLPLWCGWLGVLVCVCVCVRALICLSCLYV